MLQVVEDLNSFQDQLGRDQAACSPLLEAIGDIKFKESVKYIEAAYKQLVQGKTYFIKWLSKQPGPYCYHDIKFKESVKYIEAAYKQLVQGKKYFIKWLSKQPGPHCYHNIKFKESVNYIEAAYKQLVQGKQNL